MSKDPYPSQIAPKPARKKPSPSKAFRQSMEMPKKIGKRNSSFLTEKEKPYKNPYKDERGNMPKPKDRKTKPAKFNAYGIMGSSTDQAKQRKEKALQDMRKRGMLRKKQGQ